MSSAPWSPVVPYLNHKFFSCIFFLLFSFEFFKKKCKFSFLHIFFFFIRLNPCLFLFFIFLSVMCIVFFLHFHLLSFLPFLTYSFLFLHLYSILLAACSFLSCSFHLSFNSLRGMLIFQLFLHLFPIFLSPYFLFISVLHFLHLFLTFVIFISSLFFAFSPSCDFIFIF